MARAPGVPRLQVSCMPPVGVVDAAVQRQLRRRAPRACRSASRCSSATGLCSSSRQRTGSSSRKRLVVSWSQLHHRFCDRADSRRCAGATNWPSVRASPTVGASCAPATSGASHLVGARNARLDVSARTSTPWSRPRSTIGTPRKDRYGSSPASRKYLKRGWRVASATDCGLELLGDEPGEAFGDPHADAADAFGPQPDRRREHQRRCDRARAGRPSRRRSRTAAE